MNDQPRTPPFKLPEDCADMREVRAAARIKPSRDAVRDEARKAAVIEAAVEDARTRNLPADKIADLWDLLVETSIAYELVEWERLRA